MAGRLIVSGVSALEYWRVCGGAHVLTEAEIHELPEASRRFCDKTQARCCAFLQAYMLHAPLELAVSSMGERRSSGAARFRHFKKLPEPGDLFDAGDDFFVCKPELAILQCAFRSTIVELNLLMSEFCGTYLLSPGDSRGFVSTSTPLASMDSISELLSRSPQQVRCARRKQQTAFASAAPASNSPMESKIAAFFSLPREVGGLAVPGIQLNKRIELKGPSRQILNHDEIRPDFYFPGAVTVGEYKSRQFHPEGSWTTDDRRIDALEAVGFHSFSLNNERVKRLAEFVGIGQVLMERMGSAFLRATKHELEMRSALHAELFL